MTFKQVLMFILVCAFVALSVGTALAACYVGEYSYYDTDAYAKICCEYRDGHMYVTCQGDDLYRSSSEMECDERECFRGTVISKTSALVLPEGRTWFYCWDRDDSDDYYSWAYAYCYQDVEPKVSLPAQVEQASSDNWLMDLINSIWDFFISLFSGAGTLSGHGGGVK